MKIDKFVKELKSYCTDLDGNCIDIDIVDFNIVESDCDAYNEIVSRWLTITIDFKDVKRIERLKKEKLIEERLKVEKERIEAEVYGE